MSKQKGDLAENKAVLYLESKKYKIIERNFYAKKLGEIDIIAKINNIYHFLEVKSANDYETAINNITKTKLSKLKRSIDYYLQINNLDEAYCIDAIIVINDDIEHLENITF
ncbi:YraN family protein [Arcobacter sp. CECT 8985]|uniref:YraN family protein n=1 Tax=Arcobacter sp. CECT 8985 TaxID=1935424 RepID=UPI00100BAE6F|nr:YraN family protein [Arcobacter sp. CECT 8985]RXJ87729.1 hypothetical protein CRU93_02745 [Arcobacter sp. CECT 8985]